MLLRLERSSTHSWRHFGTVPSWTHLPGYPLLPKQAHTGKARCKHDSQNILVSTMRRNPDQ